MRPAGTCVPSREDVSGYGQRAHSGHTASPLHRRAVLHLPPRSTPCQPGPGLSAGDMQSSHAWHAGHPGTQEASAGLLRDPGHPRSFLACLWPSGSLLRVGLQTAGRWTPPRAAPGSPRVCTPRGPWSPARQPPARWTDPATGQRHTGCLTHPVPGGPGWPQARPQGLQRAAKVVWRSCPLQPCCRSQE